MKTNSPNPLTVGIQQTRIRVVSGGGAKLQQTWSDREQFSMVLIELRMLGERATQEEADYMRRNLRQVAERFCEKGFT